MVEHAIPTTPLNSHRLVDEDGVPFGLKHTNNVLNVVPYVLDPISGTIGPMSSYNQFSPFVDIDTSYIFNPDGTVQQKIETGIGQTKTTVYTYAGGYLQSEAVVIT
jgi:hypothetical protein